MAERIYPDDAGNVTSLNLIQQNISTFCGAQKAVSAAHVPREERGAAACYALRRQAACASVAAEKAATKNCQRAYVRVASAAPDF